MKSIFFLILWMNLLYIRLEKVASKEKQDILLAGISTCSCASTFPSCCSPEFMTYSCDCSPKPDCGSCPGMENMFVNIHDNMLKLAMKDAFNQQDLAQKAKIQVDLFQKAQEFAKEVGIQEMKAKQFAKVLNDATRKAQYSRALMFQAASQIRILSDQTIRALHPMKCLGTRCQIPNNGNSMNDAINEANMFSVDHNQMEDSQGMQYPSSPYQFKQNNSKLRGTS